MVSEQLLGSCRVTGGQYVNKWEWLRSRETLFSKIGSRLSLTPDSNKNRFTPKLLGNCGKKTFSDLLGMDLLPESHSIWHFLKWSNQSLSCKMKLWIRILFLIPVPGFLIFIWLYSIKCISCAPNSSGLLQHNVSERRGVTLSWWHCPELFSLSSLLKLS